MRQQGPVSRRSARTRADRPLRVLLGALLVLPQGIAPAATIKVTGSCNLPGAIAAANANAPRGGCPAGSGADTVELSGNVVLSRTNNGDNGLPVITSNVTIDGGGFTIKRADGAARFRILDVAAEGRLTLDGVRIVGGDVPASGGGIRSLGIVILRNSTVTGNSSGNRGGGIYARGGELSLINSTISKNAARRGGGIAAYLTPDFYSEYPTLSITDSSIARNAASARGGGLLLRAAYATLTNSTISGNSGASGGGIRSDDYSFLVIEGGRVSRNTARLEGGGLMSTTGSEVRLSEVQVVNNQATRGGGIFIAGSYDFSADTRLEYSTVSSNTATASGGGIFMSGWEGIWSLQNSTVSGNAASTGGGLYFDATYYRFEGSVATSTIVGNSATTGGGIFGTNSDASYQGLVASIVAGNTGGNCAGDLFSGLGANFDDDGTCPSSDGITVGVDLDGQLADNGGVTPTHALLAGSVAIDSAGECGIAFDQRRFKREGLCDAGAFELGGTEPVGARVVGVENRRVLCKNRTTAAKAKDKTSASSWSCEDLGVPIAPGDRVLLTSTGTATGSAPVGGSVTGLVTPPDRRVTCRNRTTKKKVSFVVRSRSWSCEAEGLAVSPGDVVFQKIKGGA